MCKRNIEGLILTSYAKSMSTVSRPVLRGISNDGIAHIPIFVKTEFRVRETGKLVFGRASSLQR